MAARFSVTRMLPVLVWVGSATATDKLVGLSCVSTEALLLTVIRSTVLVPLFQKFAATTKVNYPLLTGVGRDDLLDAYDAEIAVPVSWFVAANGCIIGKHPGIGSLDWFDQQVKALL